MNDRNWLRLSLLAIVTMATSLAVISCDEEESSDPGLVGTWHSTNADYEQMVGLRGNGQGVMVVTDIAATTCNYITFQYTSDADSIYITGTTDIGNAHYALSNNGNVLTIDPGVDQTVFARVPVAPDTTGCTYGFDAPAYDPEHANETTGGNGVADLSLANYTVHLTVLNEGGTPMPGADVSLFQGESTALVWIELAGYYPLFRVIELEGESSYTLNLTLIETGGYFQVFPTDPAHITALFADASVTAHCYSGTMADLLASGMTTIGNYMAIRIHGEAAALGDDDSIVNLGLFTSDINEAIFQELMFSAASIMSGDVVQYCLYSINVGGMDYYLPYLQIGDVIDLASDYSYKFILTWGESPSDLDSHLFTPPIEGTPYHVYYEESGSSIQAPYAWLDVDDTTSWGPEATSIEALYPGTYTFAVHDYDAEHYGDTPINQSSGHVEVFHNRDRVGGYNVPTSGDGTELWWTVGTVDGASGDFTPVNTLSFGQPVQAPRSILKDMPIK